jgi:hypothetical protein
MQRTFRWQALITALPLNIVLRGYQHPQSRCWNVFPEHGRMLAVTPWATGHKHFSAFAKRDPPNPESSLVSCRETGQLEKTTSSRQWTLPAVLMELKELLWPAPAPNKMEKAPASGRGGMLPNQNMKSSALKSGAPGAGDSSSQMAQGTLERGPWPISPHELHDEQKIPSDLDGWLLFVEDLHRTHPMKAEVVWKTLQALTIIDNVSEREEDVSAAFLFLIEAAQRLDTPAHCILHVSNAVDRHTSLKTAMISPSSPLLESIRGLMQAAASKAVYTNPSECTNMATAQVSLRMPCTEFWQTLIEKELEELVFRQVSDLVHCRMCLSFESLMSPPSNAEWGVLLRATCKSLNLYMTVNRNSGRIVRTLHAISGAVQKGYPASAADSPCFELQKLAVEMLFALVPRMFKLGPDLVIQSLFAADILNVSLKPAASSTLMCAINRACPEVQAKEAVVAAASFPRQGLPIRTEVGAALSSTLLHTLPVMPPCVVCDVLEPFMTRGHRIWLKEDTWAALLRAVCRVAPELSPRLVCKAVEGLDVLVHSSGWSLDEQTIDAVLAAVERTARRIHPECVADTTRAFGSIPLPFDSPAGKALLARSLQVLEEMSGARGTPFGGDRPGAPRLREHTVSPLQDSSRASVRTQELGAPQSQAVISGSASPLQDLSRASVRTEGLGVPQSQAVISGSASPLQDSSRASVRTEGLGVPQSQAVISGSASPLQDSSRASVRTEGLGVPQNQAVILGEAHAALIQASKRLKRSSPRVATDKRRRKNHIDAKQTQQSINRSHKPAVQGKGKQRDKE